MADLAQFNIHKLDRSHGIHNVTHKSGTFVLAQQPVQIPGLCIMVVLVVGDAVGLAGHLERSGAVIRRFLGTTEAVRFIIDGGSAVIAVSHGAIALMVMHRTLRTVNRQLVMVRTDPVAMSVGVGEQAALEHFIR
ncbi:hypothetical protein D3C71_1604820 [compost metagenome]